MAWHRLVCATALIATLSGAAWAEESGNSKFSVLAGAGYTWGGDTLVSIQLDPVSGTSGRTYYEDLSGGAGLDLRLGGQWLLSNKTRLQAMVAFHNDQANGIHGHASYRRVPVELLGHYKVSENWWVGGGLRKSTNGTLDREAGFTSGGVTLPSAKWNIKFDAAAVLEAEYMMNNNWGFKLRGVRERGRFEGYTEKFNADHFGLILTYYFN
ncbi:MAG TPA: hypothetical protein VFM48_12205 [Aquabacterium sp.]|nr:hypothetical protein [Aquabacterium sp.]